MGMRPPLEDNPVNFFLKPEMVGFEDLFIDSEDEIKGIRRGTSMLVSGQPGAGKTTFVLSMIRSLMGGVPFKSLIKEQKKPDANSCKVDLMYYISLESEKKRLEKAYTEMGWFSEGDMFDDFQHLDRKKRGLAHVLVPPMELDRPVKSSEDTVNYLISKISRHNLAPDRYRDIVVVVDSVSALLRDCNDTGERRRQTYELIHRLRDAFGFVKATHNNPEKPRLALMIFIAEKSVDDEASEGIEEYLTDYVFQLGSKTTPLGRRLRTLQIKKSQGSNMLAGDHTWAIMTKDNYYENVQEASLRLKILNQGLSRVSEYSQPLCSEDEKKAFSNELKKLSKKFEFHFPKQSTLLINELAERPDFAKTENNPKPPAFSKQIRVLVGTIKDSLSKLEAKGKEAAGSLNKSQKALRFIGDISKSLNWGTVAIFARPRLQNPVNYQSIGRGDDAPCSTGTKGLDQMLKKKMPSGLAQGSTTLILGAAGMGTTTLCFQFLVAGQLDSRKTQPEKVLFINFSPLSRWTLNSWLSRDFKKWAKQHQNTFRKNGRITNLKLRKPEPEILCYQRGQLDLNLLLAEISTFIRHSRPTRIAIDGVSELLTMSQLENVAYVLEKLIATIKSVAAAINKTKSHRSDYKGYKPTIFIACETGPDLDFLNPDISNSAAGGILNQGISADNIIKLKQVYTKDKTNKKLEFKKVIHVVKTAGQTSMTTFKCAKSEKGAMVIEEEFEPPLDEKRPDHATNIGKAKTP